MSLNNEPPPRHYHFLILGFWMQPPSHPGESSQCRISLEDPHTTERSGFKTLTELNAFLQVWMDQKAGKKRDAHEEDE